ncbi:MAG: metallophosphoesterase [Candidatus Methylacidiphilales bacterium]
MPDSTHHNLGGAGINRRHFLGMLTSLAIPSVAFGEQTAAEEEVNLIAIGDWGAAPDPGDPSDAPKVAALQKRVADGVSRFVEENLKNSGKKLTAILALGDNFYGKLKGPDDPRFVERMEKLYPEAPMYFVLGNHDYEDHKRENWKHQIGWAARNPESRWKWPAAQDATWYTKQLPEASPLVSIIALDTNTDHVKDKWDDQIKFLKAQMASDTSPWRIVIAHHPMWTDGYHWDGKKDPGLYPKIRKTVLPELSRAVFYVSAHDHNLQHIHHPDHPETEFFISGSGGGDFAQDRRSTTNRGYTNDFYKTYGFLYLNFTRKQASAQLVEVQKDGKIQLLKEPSLKNA